MCLMTEKRLWTNLNSYSNISKRKNGSEVKCYLRALCPCPNTVRQVAPEAWNEPRSSSWMQMKTPVLGSTNPHPCCTATACISKVFVEAINPGCQGGDTGQIRPQESTNQRRQLSPALSAVSPPLGSLTHAVTPVLHWHCRWHVLECSIVWNWHLKQLCRCCYVKCGFSFQLFEKASAKSLQLSI